MLQQMGDSWCEFGVNLARLKQSGMPVPEVSDQTKGITEQWQRFQSMLLPNVTNASMNQHALAAIAQGECLLRYVDTTVKLYERLAK